MELVEDDEPVSLLLVPVLVVPVLVVPVLVVVGVSDGDVSVSDELVELSLWVPVVEAAVPAALVVVVLVSVVVVVVSALRAASCAAVSRAAATAVTPVSPMAPASIPRLTRLTRRCASRRRVVGDGLMAASLDGRQKTGVIRLSDVCKRPPADAASRLCRHFGR